MRHLSNKEKKQLIEKLPKGYEIEKKDEIKEKDNILIKNGNPFLLIENDKFLPLIKSINEEEFAKVYVDNGAIKFVTKGADLMRPGIEDFPDNFEKNEVIIIKNRNFESKILALAISMYSKEETQNLDKGKVMKIYHYLGDEIFKFEQ